MQRLLIDLRYAIRQLTRAPGFTLSVVLILALGIGISTAVVSAVDHVLFRPLDLPDSERLVTLCEVHDNDRDYCTVSPPNAGDWAANVRTIEAIGVARYRGVEIHDGERKTAALAAMATPGFLQAAGIVPLHGRLLQDSDMLPRGTASVIVLSYELWQEQFGGDAGIIGRDIIVSSGGDGRILEREPVTVIGVLPSGVDVPRFGGTRAWIPLQIDAGEEQYRGWRGFVGLARLSPRASIADAAADLNRVQAALAQSYPEQLTSWTVDVHRLRDYIVRDVRPLLLLFLAAVAVVLTIVCVNVVTLLLARATRRERELTVLAALGAGRSQLVQQLLVEALILAACGGIAGAVLATWLVEGLVLLAPAGVPRIADIAVDGRVLLLMGGVTLLIGLLFGAVPALRLRYGYLHDVLRQGRTSTGDRRGQRLRRALVVSQLALALALLLSAALLMRSFGRLAAYDPGFQIEGLLTFQVYPPMWRYDTRERRRELYEQIRTEIEAIPGVIAVGTASSGPLFGGGDGRTPFLVHGRDDVAIEDAPTTEWVDAGPHYFTTLGVPLVAGRNLSAHPERGDVMEALINETMARRHWPGASPVGARLSLPNWDAEVEVVGLVADLRAFGSTAPTQPAIFVSSVLRPRGASFFVVRTSAEPDALMPDVRRVLERIDSDIPPRSMAAMADLLRTELVAPRFNLLLITLFAGLALLLSTAGVYALVAYTVTLRTREFGIRLALGARASQVLFAVLLDSGRMLAAGLLIGSIGALYFARLLRGLLHDVAPTDPAAVVIAVALLGAAALVAAAAPAIRAARTQPASVLHAD